MKRLLLVAIAMATLHSSVCAETVDSREPKFSGSLRYRAEIFSDLDFNGAVGVDNDYILQRLRLNADLPIGEKSRAYVVLQDSRIFGEEFLPRLTMRPIDLQQGFFETRDLFGTEGLSLKAGRQEIAYGKERIVGKFAFNNVGRTYDGFRMRYDRDGGWHELFIARIINDPSAPSDQALSGLHNYFDLGEKRSAEAYIFRRRDARSGVDLDEYTYGVRSWGPLDGNFDYSFEGALQGGNRGVNDIDAWALHSGVGYNFECERKTRVGVEFNAASGDDDPTAGTVKTFDNMFPTNQYHYGLANRFSWRNMSNLKIDVSTDIAQKLRGTLAYHWFKLQDVRDFWYAANRVPIGFIGRDATGTVSDDAGSEIDVLLKYKWRPDVALEFGAGIFDPGSRAAATPRDTATAIYFQTVWKF